MRHTFFKFLSLLLLGLVIIITPGCLPTSGEADVVSKEPMVRIRIPKIDIYNQLDRKSADGKFLVVHLNIENVSTQTINFKAPDVQLQFVSDDPESRYTQESEKRLSPYFAKIYGTDNRDKLIDARELTVNPKMNIERYIIFMLNEDAELFNYQILFKKDNTTTPLLSPETEITDYRTVL